VHGYGVKSAAPRDLFKAVHAVAARHRYLALQALPAWTAGVRVPESPAELTPREHQVHLLLAWGSNMNLISCASWGSIRRGRWSARLSKRASSALYRHLAADDTSY